MSEQYIDIERFNKKYDVFVINQYLIKLFIKNRKVYYF